MSKSVLWSTAVFTVFAFATLILFFWIKEGSLEGAGSEMDGLLSKAGSEISQTTTAVVSSTGDAIDRSTDGDERT